MQIEDDNVMPDMLGRTIGQYQLIELIGEGDTSLVYKAFQPGMGRYVAFRVLLPALAASPAFMEQFQVRLARTAALQHNHILPLYDYGQEDEAPYLVTRYVETGTLEDYLPDYYAPHAALRMIKALAGALDYAHQQGLVHANLKPANILIDEEQRPLLAEFGALRQEPIVLQLSNPYTSPEQTQGAPVSQASDVYGLGALLYTLLIGEPPPSNRVPTPRLYRPNLSPALEKVILKAMAPAPQQRFQSAGEFSRAVERALQPQLASTPRVESAPTPQDAEPVHVPAPDKQHSSLGSTGLLIFFGALVLLAAVTAVYFIFFNAGDDATVIPTEVPGEPGVPQPTAPAVETVQPLPSPTPEEIVELPVIPPEVEPLPEPDPEGEEPGSPICMAPLALLLFGFVFMVRSDEEAVGPAAD